MPELPEVEHARQRLDGWCRDKRIERAEVLDAFVLEGDAADWKAALVGRTVSGVARHGKLMIASLSQGHAFSVHLGMTGHLSRVGEDDELPRFTRWWLGVERSRVCYVDARKIGRSVAGSAADVALRSGWDALGPDAAQIEDAAALRARMGKSSLPLKALLMDQQRLAGVGNIHAAEALFLARLHPDATLDQLGDEDWQRLLEGLGETFARAMVAMGDAQDVVYLSEGGDNPFFVYQREGQACQRCGSEITREVSRGRSTYLCPTCQAPKKKPRPTKNKTAVKKTAAKKTAVKKTAVKKTAAKR